MKKDFHNGKFIVFEGIEGAGAETQTNLLFNCLKKQKTSVLRLEYPDYKGPIGKLIHQFLHRKYNFSVETQFLLYLADFIKDKERIKKLLTNGKIVICDRYFTSTIAYQGSRGFPIKRALKIAELIELPRPDFIIYLRIAPNVSIKRKGKEKKILDRNETDRKLLTKVAKMYERLIKNQVFSKWAVVDGEKTIKEVFKEVRSKIKAT